MAGTSQAAIKVVAIPGDASEISALRMEGYAPDRSMTTLSGRCAA